MNSYHDQQLEDFNRASMPKLLDEVEHIISASRDLGFINTFFLPIPAWLAIRIQCLFSQNPSLAQFRDSIYFNKFLVACSGITWGVMLWHLLPFLLGFGTFFLDPGKIVSVLSDQFNYHSIRALFIVVVNIFMARWALSSLKLTETFWAQKEAMQKAFTVKLQDAEVQLKVAQDLMQIKPELMRILIMQLTASGEFTQSQSQKILGWVFQALDQLHIDPSSDLPLMSLDKDSAKACEKSYGENPFVHDPEKN
ncbi:hypothetical protein IQ225_18915 [Synechocystis salina LEGE 06155]|nr:hypothetical protein [Synechocystis salina LEGE 06155]